MTTTEQVGEGFVSLNGTRFYYELAGRGRPLVLLHAGIADCRMWETQFDSFARQRLVLRHDRRGFGKTAMTDGTFAHHRDLFDLLTHLGVVRATLLGCSQGSRIAVDLALEHPEIVDSLVLVSPALGGYTHTAEPPRQWRELEKADEEGDVARVNELELQVWVDGPRRTPEQVDPAVRELVREMNRVALSVLPDLGTEETLEPPAANRLEEINVPTAVVVGDLDTRRTLDVADFLCAKVAGARKFVVREAAHLPNMERPAEFNRIVLEFLNDCCRDA